MEHRYMLVVILPDHVSQQLRTIQKRYNLPPWQPAMPLHITLVIPFGTDASLQDLSDRLAPVTDRAAFTIELDGLDRFDNEQSVLFAHVVPNRELSELASDANGALAGLAQPSTYPFTPHVTLADSTTRENVDDYVRRLSGQVIRYSFTCDRLSLLQKNAMERRWDVVSDFPFVDASSER